MKGDILADLLLLQVAERSRASECAREWANNLTTARAALKQIGLDEQSIAVSHSASEALADLPHLGLFSSSLLARFLELSRVGVINTAIARINDELELRVQVADERKAEYDEAASQKTTSVSAAIAHKRRVVEQVNETKSRAQLSRRLDPTRLRLRFVAGMRGARGLSRIQLPSQHER